jgi:DNA-binding PadR family transcriptional regulator
VEGKGVPRKYYHITGAGRKEQQRLAGEWQSFAAAIGRILKSTNGSSPSRRR